MKHVLAVDLGGTKILFELSTQQGHVIYHTEFASAQFDGFTEVLSVFLSKAESYAPQIESACVAIAGPVTGREASVTNLPWQLNADEVAQRFDISHVHFCNDFEAVGYGISELSEGDFITLQTGKPLVGYPRAVIGAGTGLGQAILLPKQEDWQVLPTEGGHVDFAPTNSTQIMLLEHLMARYGRVSYEHVVSGNGLVSIYEFLRAYRQHDENSELRKAMIADGASAAISRFALANEDKVAIEALDMFVEIYASQASNLALSVLSRSGLYIAGGIAAKNAARFKGDLFLNAFNTNAKMQPVLETIPVYLILQAKVGLIGARVLALQWLNNKNDN